MIELLFFFTISIFNGVEDIEYEAEFIPTQEKLKQLCLNDRNDVIACIDSPNRIMYFLVSKMTLEVIEHEKKHALLYESCVIFVGYLPNYDTEFCIEFSNWHD